MDSSTSDQYCVIELLVEDKLYASPCLAQWLHGVTISHNKSKKPLIVAESCDWPPDESKLSLLLLSKSKPKSDWLSLKNIRVLGFCSSLMKAKPLAEKFMINSEISDDDALPNKRKRKATSHYQAGLDSSSDTDDEAPSRNTKLAKLNISKTNDVERNASDENRKICRALFHDEQNFGRNSPSPVNVNVSINSGTLDVVGTGSKSPPIGRNSMSSPIELNAKSVPTGTVPKSIPTGTLSKSVPTGTVTKSIPTETRSKSSPTGTVTKIAPTGTVTKITPTGTVTKTTPTGTVSNSTPTGTLTKSTKRSGSTPTMSSSPSRFNRSPFKLASEAGITSKTALVLQQFRSELNELKTMVYAIYTTICNPKDLNMEESMPNIPISSEENLEKFENYCIKDEKKLGLVKFLAEFGGKDLRGSVFSVMAKLITNEFAMDYNLTGVNRKGAVKEKLRFTGTLMYGVAKAAVKLHAKLSKQLNPTVPMVFNTELFDSAVSDWLKDSKKRYSSELSQKKKSEERALKRTADENDEEGNGSGDEHANSA